MYNIVMAFRNKKGNWEHHIIRGDACPTKDEAINLANQYRKESSENRFSFQVVDEETGYIVHWV